MIFCIHYTIRLLLYDYYNIAKLYSTVLYTLLLGTGMRDAGLFLQNTLLEPCQSCTANDLPWNVHSGGALQPPSGPAA